ncbi:MAG TPA: rod shape-determining protein MreC [Candidatus Acidoferrales bacterium]|nr:rod shape-determining protein MreC [Candidatus Acidoferrales bacterium]
MFKWLSEFYRVAKNYIVFALLLSFSFFLISTNNNIHTRGLQTIGLLTTSYLEDIVKSVVNYFSLSSRNEELERENAQLVDLTAKIRRALLENGQLRSMLKLRSEITAPLIPANVIGRSTEEGKYFLTLDAGEKDNVYIGDPVVSGEGLVGTVIATSGNFCMVRTLLDNDSRIAAKLFNASADGIIVSGEFGELSMKNVSRRYAISRGDIVETSSLSSLVPPGIVIGSVSSAADETGNIFKKIKIQPAVDFSSLSVAFIMHYSRSSEASGLEEKELKKKR